MAFAAFLVVLALYQVLVALGVLAIGVAVHRLIIRRAGMDPHVSGIAGGRPGHGRTPTSMTLAPVVDEAEPASAVPYPDRQRRHKRGPDLTLLEKS